MKIRIDFELTKKQVNYLLTLYVIRGVRPRVDPQKTWTDAERKDYARRTIKDLILTKLEGSSL